MQKEQVYLCKGKDGLRIAPISEDRKWSAQTARRRKGGNTVVVIDGRMTECLGVVIVNNAVVLREMNLKMKKNSR